MPWISPLLFLSSRMYRKFSKYQRASVWTGSSSMSRPCCNSKYQPAIWYNGWWRLFTKVIRQCLFLHCKEPVFAVSKQSSRCCSSRVAKPSTTYRNSSEAVEDQQVQFLIVAAHTSDTCSKTCSAVPCLRHSYILTAILRAYIGSLWIPSLLFAEKQRKI